MATAIAARRVDLPGTADALAKDLTTLGKRVAWARTAKNLTQVELAKTVEKARATIVQYEMDNINPPIKEVEKLADALGVTPEFLAFGRHGIDGVKHAADMVPIGEVAFGRDGEYPDGGHALSREMLNDFGVDPSAKLRMMVLPVAAPKFQLLQGARLLIEETGTIGDDDDNTHYVVRTGRGIDVIRLESSFGPSKGKLTLTTGNGRVVETKSSDLDIIGPLLSVISPVPR